MVDWALKNNYLPTYLFVRTGHLFRSPFCRASFQIETTPTGRESRAKRWRNLTVTVRYELRAFPPGDIRDRTLAVDNADTKPSLTSAELDNKPLTTIKLLNKPLCSRR